MKKIIIATLALSALTSAALAGGRLDAKEPDVRNYDVQVKIETGYLTDAEIAADIRGGGKDVGDDRA